MGQQGPQQQSLLAPEPTTHQGPFPHDARERWAEHLPPAPNQANQLMMRLERKRGHGEDDEPFPRKARSHIRFERIHPFEGSNGRTGCILISRSLMGSRPAPVVTPSRHVRSTWNASRREAQGALPPCSSVYPPLRPSAWSASPR